MTPIRFTTAGKDDIPVIISLRIAFFTELTGPQDEARCDTLRESLHDYYQEALGETYLCEVAREGDEVVGIGGMVLRQHPGNFSNPRGRQGYVNNMYTLPSHRGRGISSALLGRLVESAKARGIRFFELHATKEGEGVYQRFGFAHHKEPTYRLLLPD